MNGKPLSVSQKSAIAPGEAITLTAVLAIMSVAILAVVVYRIFMSKKGSLKVPGGWAFSWN